MSFNKQEEQVTKGFKIDFSFEKGIVFPSRELRKDVEFITLGYRIMEIEGLDRRLSMDYTFVLSPHIST